MHQTLAVVVLVLSIASSAAAARQVPSGAEAALYVCADTATSSLPDVGATLCDAMTTPALTQRSDEDNLQVREGALVLDLESSGVSSRAGLQPGDMIYRVGGVDVADAEAAAETLSQLEFDSDTVVNFLRGGRPYRVKLRQE